MATASGAVALTRRVLTEWRTARYLIALLLLGELVLCVLIIRFIKYTEIDWRAYMQEVEGPLIHGDGPPDAVIDDDDTVLLPDPLIDSDAPEPPAGPPTMRHTVAPGVVAVASVVAGAKAPPDAPRDEGEMSELPL